MASPSPARRRRGASPVDATSSTSSSTDAAPAAASVASADASFVPTASTTSFVPLAVAARNGSPAVLLGALALCFNGLVGDPKLRQAGVDADADSTAIATLAGLLGVATVVQVAASVVGLPPAGSVAPPPPPQNNDSAKKQRKAARKDGRKPNVIVTTVLSLVLTALATPLVHLVLVLFGAPFLAQTSRTFLCAAHLAVLGLYPVIYTRGTDGTGAWRALASGSQTAKQLDAAVGGLWGACAGAWLGAVPIPLDWDRSWQAWPITVVVGIYLGHAVGRTLGGALQRR